MGGHALGFDHLLSNCPQCVDFCFHQEKSAAASPPPLQSSALLILLILANLIVKNHSPFLLVWLLVNFTHGT